jgi:hypothetical protein
VPRDQDIQQIARRVQTLERATREIDEIADAETSHTIASFGDAEAALDALGEKVNAILAALKGTT